MSQVEWLQDGEEAIHHVDEPGTPNARQPIHYVQRFGIYFHKDTPLAVCQALYNARQMHTRLRIFLGDADTGRDWHEENDVAGYIGCSMGPLKVPLLICNSRSSGGGAILDHCIVRIINNKTGQQYYKHPQYHHGNFIMRTITDESLLAEGYKVAVDVDGVNHANFKPGDKVEGEWRMAAATDAAQAWIKKMTRD